MTDTDLTLAAVNEQKIKKEAAKARRRQKAQKKQEAEMYAHLREMEMKRTHGTLGMEHFIKHVSLELDDASEILRCPPAALVQMVTDHVKAGNRPAHKRKAHAQNAAALFTRLAEAYAAVADDSRKYTDRPKLTLVK